MEELGENATSSWAASQSQAGWSVGDGPISNFSGIGRTGNQLPGKQELNGRAGEGRAGASQGQFLGDVAKGLPGRKTPTRNTNDPYEQGVVKELQQMATGGPTGGGKARGSGQEGLQGESPPPLMDGLPFMKDWQQRIRQKAERLSGQLDKAGIHLPNLDKTIAFMKSTEQSAEAGRYAEMFKTQKMVLGELAPRRSRLARGLAARGSPARVPPNQRRRVLDAMEEPMPQEYQGAVQRYFEKLSEAK